MLYIILPVHNRKETTALFIECLKKQTYKEYHLLLIDDGSTDGTDELVQNKIEHCTVIKGKGDWWWAGSLQQGYNWISENVHGNSSTVLLINDDVEFEKDFLEIGLNILSMVKKTIVYAKAISKQSKKVFYSGVTVNWKSLSFVQASSDNQVNCTSTRGLFLKLPDFLSIGGFYPKLLPHYISDYEYTIRAYRKGYKFHSDDSLTLIMDETTSGFRSINSRKDFLKRYFSIKNPNNPIYLSMFIILSCPLRFKGQNILKIWKGAAINIIKGLFYEK